jgi:hypothetical protein
MTTGDCAKHLNAVIGEPLFQDRDLLEKVEAGELVCINPNRGRRERARITRVDFCRFVSTHYPDYSPAMSRRLGLFHGESGLST